MLRKKKNFQRFYQLGLDMQDIATLISDPVFMSVNFQVLKNPWYSLHSAT